MKWFNLILATLLVAVLVGCATSGPVATPFDGIKLYNECHQL